MGTNYCTFFVIDLDGQSLKSISTSTRKSAKIVAVAQAKLTFMNPTQTGTFLHFYCIKCI